MNPKHSMHDVNINRTQSLVVQFWFWLGSNFRDSKNAVVIEVMLGEKMNKNKNRLGSVVLDMQEKRVNERLIRISTSLYIVAQPRDSHSYFIPKPRVTAHMHITRPTLALYTCSHRCVDRRTRCSRRPDERRRWCCRRTRTSRRCYEVTASRKEVR